jgi:hypothetical protein
MAIINFNSISGVSTISVASSITVGNVAITSTTITAPTFTGNVTGNLTGNVTGTVNSTSGITTVTQLNVGIGGTVITTTVGGLLGIGTNNPYGKTHIEINAAAGTGSGNACALWLKNANQTANNSATIFAGNDSSAACAAINFVHANYSNNQGFISFDTRENALTYNSNAFKIDAYGRLTAPYQPCFLAFRGGTQTYSSYNTIIFNDEVFDQGSNYNSSTGIFTAPVTGRYLFLATVLVQSSSTGNDYDIELNTSNRGYFGAPGRTETASGTSWGDGYIAHAVQQIADMDANDTAGIRYITFGGGAIYGGGGWTRFSGYLIC